MKILRMSIMGNKDHYGNHVDTMKEVEMEEFVEQYKSGNYVVMVDNGANPCDNSREKIELQNSVPGIMEGCEIHSLCLTGKGWFNADVQSTDDPRLKYLAMYPVMCLFKSPTAYLVLSEEEYSKFKNILLEDENYGLYLCIE